MGTLNAAARKHVAQSRFGLPAPKGPDGGAHGKYPMPDKAHAKDAKARASEEHAKGKLSSAQEARIDAMADRILGKSEGDGTSRASKKA